VDAGQDFPPARPQAHRLETAEQGGTIAARSPKVGGSYGLHLYEFAWGHARHHVNHTDPDIVSLVGLFPPDDLVGSVLRVAARLADVGPLQFEAKRIDGLPSFQGSPSFRYQGEVHMAEVLRRLEAEGIQTANNQTWKVR